MSGESIGMMEGAFFVSKGIILEWLNELLDVSNYRSYMPQTINLLIALTIKN